MRSGTGTGIELERNVVGIQPGITVSDQHPQRVLTHDAVQCFGSGFGKVRGNVHGGFLNGKQATVAAVA
jgi:hypothetical protein